VAKLLRKRGGGPADRHDQVEPVSSKRGPYALRDRDFGCLTARARRLNGRLDELDRLARRPDQIPYERVGKSGLRRKRSLGGLQNQHVPGLAASQGRQRAVQQQGHQKHAPATVAT
jgi:hypothetical protein